MPRPKVLGERIRHWGGLPAHEMRREKLREYVVTVSPTSVACAIEELLVQTRGKNPDAVAIYLAMIDLLVRPDGVAGMGEIWRREAFRRGMAEVCYLLTEPPVFGRAEDEEEPQIHPELQELTLGEKKALARVVIERDIEKFLNETDVRVLEILFRHPSLTPKYVVRMLARRPQNPDVFRMVATYPRWLSLSDIQKAIVFNPFAPPGLSLKLLPLLRLSEISEVADARNLAPSVRAYAERLKVLRDYASEDFADDVEAVRWDAPGAEG